MGKKKKNINKGIDASKANVTMNNYSNGQMNYNIVKGDNVNKITNDNRKFIEYKYNRVCNAVSKIPDMDDSYRGMLAAIENETHSSYHKFSGFINHIDLRKNVGVVCNIFWNNDVYVCNHINDIGEKPEDPSIFNNIKHREITLYMPNFDVKVGDFIIFKGKITSYYMRRNGTEDKGIEMEDILDVIHHTEILCPDILIDTDKSYHYILDNMNKDMMKRFYEIQINRIRVSVEGSKYFKSEMYEAILQTVLYEGTREHNMIKNQLRLTINEMDKQLVCGVALLRYLVTELDRCHSPHIVYSFMNRILKPRNNNKPTYYDKAVRKFSDYEYTYYDDNYVEFIKSQYKIALNYYLKEFDDIIQTGSVNEPIHLNHMSLIDRLHGLENNNHIN